MDLNLTQIFFKLLTLIVGAIGLLIHIREDYLPVAVTRTYRYGKYAVTTKHELVAKFELPKRWFKHFYAFAAPASGIVLALTISRYICENPVPEYINTFLNLQLGNQRKALVSPECTLLATILWTVQCWKRFYETQRVSIFSDGKINAMHYCVAFAHYVGLLTCVIGESEGFVKGSNSMIRWDRLTKLQYACAIIFLLASYEQLRSNFILANLRKDKHGNVVTKAHKIPRGRLFEYISAPLQFTEIIMYGMSSIILWRSSTYHYVFLWVLVNQIESGTSTHRWYLKKFQNYPKQRKTLIPYLL